MKKFVLAIALIVCSFSLLVATPGEYDDIVDAMLKVEKVFVSFTEASNGINSASDAVKVINAFKEGIVTIIPSLKALEVKYPNMEDLKKNPPAEIKAISDRLEKAAGSLETLIPAKYMPYMTESTVITAFTELQAVMNQMNPQKEQADQTDTEK